MNFAKSLFPLAVLAAASLAPGFAQQREEPRAPVPPPPFSPNEVLNIWPGTAPGETGDVGPEYMLVERRRPFYQIAEVSTPTLAVYLPEREKATGAGVLVIPGGGLVRLAIEHEGYEVARWLRDKGVAAFVLKYRIPGVGRETFWKKGVQDAQRAMSIIRARADEWGVDPDGVGAIGFSAGGEIGTRMSLNDTRQYAAVDATDKQPTRPNFMLNIYPGGLRTGGRDGDPVALRKDIFESIDERATPPMFFAHAFGDDSLNSLLMTLELKRRNIPAELHIFRDGAHGFGVRDTGAPVGAWRGLALAWMGSLGFLDPPHVRQYSEAFSKAGRSEGALPRITDAKADATLAEAYRAQTRIIEQGRQPVAGYKGAMSTPEAMEQYGITAPLHCSINRRMLFNLLGTNSYKLADLGPSLVETELGYVMGVDIPTKIADPEEARLASQAVVAAIDVPTDFAARSGGPFQAVDFAAANCGDRARIILGERFHPDDYQVDELAISLSRDGKVVHETKGAASKGGQWYNLMTLINQIIDQGRVIHEGDLIISGSLGAPMPAEPGNYTADYGPLGKVEFELQ